ncbi:hypothetical protein P9112_002631 [Eukaryota sp. TZLM1-RC]
MHARPIAVSESLKIIFSACCLSRFNEKAKKILLPFQYGINTTDGVSSAIFATHVLFRQNESNVCMSLDFSNAFNSLSRRSIHGALLQYMPELMPYFQSTYSTCSNLHFGDSILSSSSGVQQGDPLGPLLFCLAIHPILLQIQEMLPSLKLMAYMDDVVLIGDLNIVKQATEHLINSDVNNPLLAGEKYKIAKYAKPISSVNENSHAQYNLCPFVFSLLGSLGKAAMAFLEDFVVVVKERTGRIFNRVYWQNRIVFSVFKGMVKLISESLAINCFDVGEAGFEDVEFYLCISYLLLNK